MRIGFDGRHIQDHFPGIGRYAYSLLRALGPVDRDNEYVVYFDPRQVNTRYDLSTLERANVRLCPVPASPFSLAEQVRMPLAARRDRLDVFHSPYYVKPYALTCPSVVTIHDAIGMRFPQYFPSLKTRLSFRPAMWMACATSRIVVVPSHATMEDLIHFFGVTRDKVVVTYYGAEELAATVPGGSGEADAAATVDGGNRQVRGGPALPVSEPFLLYVGTNKPHKNLVQLVRAYAQAGVGPSLVLAGRHDRRFPEVQAEVRRLRLEGRVHFPGEVDDAVLRQLYRSALAVVVPSLYEGFGLPALEALACGAPLASSQAGSLAEVVGDAALTFDPTSVDGMASALRSIVDDPALRADLSRRGPDRARRFSWKRAALETLSVYERACQGGR